MQRYIHIFLILLTTTVLAGCNDMHDITRPQPQFTEDTKSKIVVLCEGLFNMNNSTLALFDPKSQSIEYDVFTDSNKRGLGDTANDMKLHNGKLYVIVNVSSRLEIIDTATFVSVKQIPFFNEQGVARQPRYIVFDNQYGYISCFDGYVARLDLTSLEIDRWVKCGRNPDNLTLAAGKLYVSNSGGLDNPNYDTTVSVIDLKTFEEIKKIEVGKNPGSIAADSQGDVYVVTRGNYSRYSYDKTDTVENQYRLHKIDTEIDERIETYSDINALNMTICNDTAYMYSYDFNLNSQWIKTFDCLTDRIVSDSFITDSTQIQTPFGIDIDPLTGNVYISESYDFVNWGDILCFDRHGKLRYRINEVGLNPNNIAILN